MSDPAKEPIEVFSVEEGGRVTVELVELTPDQWRERLNEEEFRILRKKGTERAFTGRHWDEKAPGVYRCAGCGNDLFLSGAKFDSGTGWPSFWEPVDGANIAMEADNTLFMRRTEVLCRRCQGHLGHVFTDGPEPTGLRYCMNGNAMKFDRSEGDG